jgi:polyhydroxybutyrate depolymerase
MASKRIAFGGLVAAASLMALLGAGTDAGAAGLDLRCPLAPGRSSFSLRVASRTRRVVVEVGSQAGRNGPAPIVFFWHGWGGDARGQLDWVGAAKAWPEAVFVAPEGLPRRFPGAGARSLPGWQIASGELDDRDLQLFDALVTALSKLECVDTSRFVSSGFSNGGYFSNLLGCRRSAVLAAIAPVGGGGPYEACESPVAAWIAHGSRDRVVAFREGRSSFASWQKRNACEGEAASLDGCSVAKNCSREVVLCSFEGGHTWPGQLTAGWRRFLEQQRRAGSESP